MLKLTDEEQASAPRVRNVLLAVNLARHSANGWDDAALPDDYRDIAEFLHVHVYTVMKKAGAPIPPEMEAAELGLSDEADAGTADPTEPPAQPQ